MSNQMNQMAPNRYAARGQTDIAQRQQQAQQGREIAYTANGETVKLSIATVRNYLVSGQKDRVTDQEIVMFINLCKYSGLNPWLREAYCIKYGNEPATMVTGKGAFERRAEANPNYDGRDAGIIVATPDGLIEYRNGSFHTPAEEIIGGWCEVYRKDRSHSTRVEVGFDEYAGRKADGTINGQWAKKPATMIRKVAVVQALREAFPADYNGLYDAAEVNVDEALLDTTPIDQSQPQAPAAQPVEQPQQVPQQDAEELRLEDLG